jgi:GNAT superfamily N-acetyltransferase
VTEAHASSARAPGTIELRRARPEDVTAVERIVFESLRSFGIEPDPQGGDADIYAFGTRETHDDWVALVDGRVVGLVALEPHEDGGWLSKLFVDPIARGRGVGGALLDRAVESGQERRYKRLGLRTRTVFEAAVRLYERAGWLRGPDPEQRGIGADRTYWLTLT